MGRPGKLDFPHSVDPKRAGSGGSHPLPLPHELGMLCGHRWIYLIGSDLAQKWGVFSVFTPFQSLHLLASGHFQIFRHIHLQGTCPCLAIFPVPLSQPRWDPQELLGGAGDLPRVLTLTSIQHVLGQISKRGVIPALPPQREAKVKQLKALCKLL